MISRGSARDGAWRDDDQARGHALPQLACYGDRGIASLPPGGWRRPAWGLRQDNARFAHGRDQHGPALRLRSVRLHAARTLARRPSGQWRPLLEVYRATMDWK